MSDEKTTEDYTVEAIIDASEIYAEHIHEHSPRTAEFIMQQSKMIKSLHQKCHDLAKAKAL